jgi:hypothetical protein
MPRRGACLRALPFLWLAVDDPAGRTSDRGVIERGWLGLHAVAPEIRTSGLWNANHVDDRYDPAFLAVPEGHIGELEQAVR